MWIKNRKVRKLKERINSLLEVEKELTKIVYSGTSLPVTYIDKLLDAIKIRAKLEARLELLEPPKDKP